MPPSRNDIEVEVLVWALTAVCYGFILYLIARYFPFQIH